jgi:hypothetical protein
MFSQLPFATLPEATVITVNVTVFPTGVSATGYVGEVTTPAWYPVIPEPTGPCTWVEITPTC